MNEKASSKNELALYPLKSSELLFNSNAQVLLLLSTQF